MIAAAPFSKRVPLTDQTQPDGRSVEPFLKWAGGKRGLLEQILPHVPPLRSGATYFEPFLGGGALFFSVRPTKAVLSDVIPELVETYTAVRDDVESVIRALRPLHYSEEAYYRIRASSPRSSAAKASRFIYLNKTCFNGLYRVNAQGKFNVPFGDHGKVLVCDEKQLRAASAALAHATLKTADFSDAVRDAKPGDVVYFDPPYTTAHTTNGFLEYNARVFSWQDQMRLQQLATRLAQRGVFVLISNADHESVRSLYSSTFSAIPLTRASTMAGNAKKRFRTTELLFVSHPRETASK